MKTAKNFFWFHNEIGLWSIEELPLKLEMILRRSKNKIRFINQLRKKCLLSCRFFPIKQLRRNLSANKRRKITVGKRKQGIYLTTVVPIKAGNWRDWRVIDSWHIIPFRMLWHILWWVAFLCLLHFATGRQIGKLKIVELTFSRKLKKKSFTGQQNLEDKRLCEWTKRYFLTMFLTA